jgi:hypothetical protein
MDAGKEFTVTWVVARQPVPRLKVIVAVPAPTPVIIPDAEPAVAIVPSLLLQVPPPPSVSVVLNPWHTTFVPLIAEGVEFTDVEIVA